MKLTISGTFFRNGIPYFFAGMIYKENGRLTGELFDKHKGHSVLYNIKVDDGTVIFTRKYVDEMMACFFRFRHLADNDICVGKYHSIGTDGKINGVEQGLCCCKIHRAPEIYFDERGLRNIAGKFETGRKLAMAS